MIGVGTWNTAAEFKDIKVTAPDGKVLFTSDFSQRHARAGRCSATARTGTCRTARCGRRRKANSSARSPVTESWTDYTLTLKARKISGAEGFLILFHITGNEDRTWWNIGGWDNTQHGVELGGTLDPKRGRIETGRWYDIKLEAVRARA